MVNPFIILALPRTGTSMLVSALMSHPDIDNVVHEFRGDEDTFLGHKYVLSNYYEAWMSKYPVIHIYRDDSIAGARSLLLMGYTFPDGVVTLPPEEVRTLASRRREQDAIFEEAADYSVSYEYLCGKGTATVLPADFSERLCDHVGATRHELVTEIRPGKKLVLKNQEEIAWLRE